MIEQLLTLDKQILIAINSMNCPLFDSLMWLVSGRWSWALIIATLLFVIRTDWKKALVVLFAVTFTITFADQISASLIKPFFTRLRPIHDPEIKASLHILSCIKGGLYGFVSNHAANSFAAATIMALITRNRGVAIAFTAWALINCYSRMYLAMHFPGDIIGGAIVGIITAATVYYATLAIARKFFSDFQLNFSKSDCRLLISSIIINFLIITTIATAATLSGKFFL